MPGFPAWAPAGSKRYKWLMAQKDDYLEAIKTSNQEDFFTDLFRRYFAEFHYSLPDDLDPDEFEPVDIDKMDELDDESRREFQLIKESLLQKKTKVCQFFFSTFVNSL
jgi:hypothetical protein